MKTHLLLLPLLAMCPALAFAQPKAAPTKTAPQISIDPAAQALMDKATATYKAAQGIRFEVESNVDGKANGQSSVVFSRPNLLRLNSKGFPFSQQVVGDGTAFYSVEKASYSKFPVTSGRGRVFLSLFSAGESASLIGLMLNGQNPLTLIRQMAKSRYVQSVKMSALALPPQVVDGSVASGVKLDVSQRMVVNGKASSPQSSQFILWFGGDSTLRRIQSSDNTPQNGKTRLMRERVFNQQLNPTFPPDTFKFDATGLTSASEEKPGQEPDYFDKRLVVGAQPFAFSAKALNGQTISPANYKGKVLLMDFWATWCGPCVASLPELQAAYKKYHAQGLEVVGISLDEDKSALTSFVKDNKMPWPQVFDGQGWKSAVPGVYGVRAIPFMLVVGRDGKIAAVNPRGKIDGAVQAALAQK